MKEAKLEVQKVPPLPTSKTTLLNMMILRAWRERWSDSQWSINIRNVLPRGLSGDVYNLADCILQQALVGSTANPLVLNYLKHSLCAHLVSHAAVLHHISKYQHFERVSCLLSLVSFLNQIIDGVTCRYKSEEHLLPAALVSLVNWLLQIISAIMKRYEIQNNMSGDDTLLLDGVILTLDKLTRNQFLLGILYVGRQEQPESYTKIRDAYSTIKTSLINTSYTFPSPSTETQLNQLAYIDVNHLHMPGMPMTENLTYCLQPLLTVNILLNPCNETAFYVAELSMIQRLKHLKLTRLIYEIIRAGLMSLSNTDETSQETLSGAFTFFKVPQIIKQLHSINLANGGDIGLTATTPTDYIPEVVDALELLLKDNLLLDSMDSKCSCNIIEFLLEDWAKHHLVTEVHVKHFSSKREKTSQMLQKRESGNQAPSIINFIRRAEVPLSGLLKSLCTDYNKVQEPVLGVLTQLLDGNSFDLILSVATVESRLKTFVARLIQCNENSMQVPGEVGKPSVIRSTLFDVSFLMLTFIVQTYGSEAVLSENGDSFFEKWARECMVERNKPKNARNIVAACDENTVDELLLTISKQEAQLKNSNITWQDTCMNLPGVLYHVLLAWEKEALTSADVKSILDNIKRRLPCFSVCATAYLCAHMNSVKEAEFLKPLNMIQQFLTPPTSEEMSTQESAKECLALAFKIIRKMQNEAHAASSHAKARALKISVNSISSNSSGSNSNATTVHLLHSPLTETFNDVWKSIMEYAWLPARAAQSLESILNVSGPEWLTKQLVEEILRCKYTRQMSKTMDIVFAVFHMDIESTTEALLRHVLPNILQNRQGDELIEPQSSVLARLCVFCIISCFERQKANKTNATSSSFQQQQQQLQKKRTRSQDIDGEGSAAGEQQAKARKLNITSIKTETLTGDGTTVTAGPAATTTTTPTTTSVAAVAVPSSLLAASSAASPATTSTASTTNSTTSLAALSTAAAAAAAAAVGCMVAANGSVSIAASSSSSSASASQPSTTATVVTTATVAASAAAATTTSSATLLPSTSLTTTTAISTPTTAIMANMFPNAANNTSNNANNSSNSNSSISNNNNNATNNSNASNDSETNLHIALQQNSNNKTNCMFAKKLETTLDELLKLFLQFVKNESLTPRAYFVYQFVSLLVEYGQESVQPVLKLFPPNLMQHILKVIATDEISAGLISRIYDLNIDTGKQNAVADLCLWRNIQLKQEYVQL